MSVFDCRAVSVYGVDMSIDEDIERFNRGLGDLFNTKPTDRPAYQSIKTKEQKAPWLKKRTYRVAGGLYSMVCNYDHHEGDRAWLVDKLQTLPLYKRESVMSHYSKLFQQAREMEPSENTRDSAARRSGNAWLVSYLDRLKSEPVD